VAMMAHAVSDGCSAGLIASMTQNLSATTSSGLPAALPLPASLDLTAALPLCEALRTLLEEGAMRLDARDVERISTPCLQVLAAAASSARARGIAFRLERASVVLAEAITDLGLATAIPIED